MMRPAFAKIALVLALVYFAFEHDSILCGIAAFIVFCEISDKDYR